MSGVYKGSWHCSVLRTKTSIEFFPRSSSSWLFYFCGSDYLFNDNFMPHISPLALWLLLSTYLPTGFEKLSFVFFFMLAFHALSICLGFAIFTFYPSNLNDFGWEIIPNFRSTWNNEAICRSKTFRESAPSIHASAFQKWTLKSVNWLAFWEISL